METSSGQKWVPKKKTSKIHKKKISTNTLDMFLMSVRSFTTHSWMFQILEMSGGEIKLKNVRHPIVAKKQTEYVPSDAHFTKDERRFQILTGPNMGGKSTFMRAVRVREAGHFPFGSHELKCARDSLQFAQWWNMIIAQVAVSLVMAQMGSFVPCDEATISIRDAILTRVGAGDEIVRGEKEFANYFPRYQNIFHLLHTCVSSLL